MPSSSGWTPPGRCRAGRRAPCRRRRRPPAGRPRRSRLARRAPRRSSHQVLGVHRLGPLSHRLAGGAPQREGRCETLAVEVAIAGRLHQRLEQEGQLLAGVRPGACPAQPKEGRRPSISTAERPPSEEETSTERVARPRAGAWRLPRPFRRVRICRWRRRGDQAASPARGRRWIRVDRPWIGRILRVVDPAPQPSFPVEIAPFPPWPTPASERCAGRTSPSPRRSARSPAGTRPTRTGNGCWRGSRKGASCSRATVRPAGTATTHPLRRLRRVDRDGSGAPRFPATRIRHPPAGNLRGLPAAAGSVHSARRHPGWTEGLRAPRFRRRGRAGALGGTGAGGGRRNAAPGGGRRLALDRPTRSAHLWSGPARLSPAAGRIGADGDPFPRGRLGHDPGWSPRPIPGARRGRGGRRRRIADSPLLVAAAGERVFWDIPEEGAGATSSWREPSASPDSGRSCGCGWGSRTRPWISRANGPSVGRRSGRRTIRAVGSSRTFELRGLPRSRLGHVKRAEAAAGGTPICPFAGRRGIARRVDPSTQPR